VKTKFVSTLWVVFILLAGCSGVGSMGSSPGAEVVEVASTETTEPDAILPSSTPQITGVGESESGGATTITAPEITPTRELTRIPCPGVLTSPNQEGPFYSTGSPEKSSLIEVGMPGTPILLVGGVFDQECNPIPGAKLDFWLADVNGEYDNAGYRLRGHVFSDQNGAYSLESIVPTEYTGRPPHIHVKVFSPQGEELLTTQMYFPGSEGSSDVTSAPDLLATYLGQDEDGRQQVIFNFMVQN
jgi:protocatechuate 3,4-dioxygenase beta subunit